MSAYIIRRLLLMIPTIIGIITINFFIVQLAPGGPVEQYMAKLKGLETGVSTRLGGSSSGDFANQQSTADINQQDESRASKGIRDELKEQLKKQFGFDKPLFERYLLMLKNYALFDFGTSFYRDDTVVDLILDKLPVSISLGLWTTLLAYLISIPLGIRKAVKNGSKFDTWTSYIIFIGYAIPSFLFAILLIVVFAGGNYLDWFPLRGLVSNNFDQLTWTEKIVDYFWHLTLPIVAMIIGGFATLTMLTKNSFLDEINKQYTVTAKAKGLTENRVLYGHVFRNAMLIIIAGLPSAIVGILFTSTLLIEVVFSLDGLGLLGFESTVSRDYPVMLGTLYVFTLIGLAVKIISDFLYTIIDPRIDFESRN